MVIIPYTLSYRKVIEAYRNPILGISLSTPRPKMRIRAIYLIRWPLISKLFQHRHLKSNSIYLQEERHRHGVGLIRLLKSGVTLKPLGRVE